MSIPVARVKHQTAVRLRVHIPSQRGNVEYFRQLRQGFADWPGLDDVKASPATASILFEAETIDADAMFEFALKNNLFAVERDDPPNPDRARPRPLPNQALEPVTAIQRGVRRITGGRLDLSGAVFFTLVGSGAYQILRGNFGAPPWYTAFWYAFGVYTKQLMDEAKDVDPE